MKKSVMLVGKTYAGKTTICQYLNREELKYKKTQAVEVINGNMIDTPGEYLENRSYYKALMVTSVNADVVLLVMEATDTSSMFPPNFATMFNKPVAGVVTKADLAQSAQKAAECLKRAGASPIFVTSAVDGSGFDKMLEYLNEEGI